MACQRVSRNNRHKRVDCFSRTVEVARSCSVFSDNTFHVQRYPENWFNSSYYWSNKVERLIKPLLEQIIHNSLPQQVRKDDSQINLKCLRKKLTRCNIQQHSPRVSLLLKTPPVSQSEISVIFKIVLKSLVQTPIVIFKANCPRRIVCVSKSIRPINIPTCQRFAK